jgi:hypothetical protein
MRLAAQSVSVNAVGTSVRVRAPGFAFIKGEALARLKDGQSVRVDLDLAVLPKPAAAAAAQVRQVFVLSYDLWEERFAVAQAGPPTRSVSHLTPAAAEAWCLDQLAVPLSALGTLGVDAPFWIRLGYRLSVGASAQATDDDSGFTLKGLIDALSRRRTSDELTQSVEAGPFRLRE